MVVIHVIFLWMFGNNHKHSKPVRKKTKYLERLTPIKQFREIDVTSSGVFGDQISLSRFQVAYIACNLYNPRSLKLLVMLSSFDNTQPKHLIHLLSEISKTSSIIDVIEDVEQVSLTDTIANLEDCGIRIGKIFKYEDNILISEISEYDVIISAHCGMRSAYEILHGLIKQISMQEQIDEDMSKIGK